MVECNQNFQEGGSHSREAKDSEKKRGRTYRGSPAGVGGWVRTSPRSPPALVVLLSVTSSSREVSEYCFSLSIFLSIDVEQ